MIKLVDRYIGRAAIFGVLGVWLAMTVLFLIFSLLEELRDTHADYTTADVKKHQLTAQYSGTLR